MPRTPRPRALAPLLAGLVLLAAGCSKSTTPTPPGGDTGGVDLLVYRSDRSGPAGQYDIWLYDFDLAGFRTVSNLNTAADESEPCLSYDGNLIAFSSDRPGGKGGTDVYVYDRGSQALVSTRSLDTAANETWPRFAYDSVRLAFARDSAGFDRVHLYDPTGDSLVALPGLSTGGPRRDRSPAPDLHGDRIAFQTDRAGNWDVMVWNHGGGLASIPDLASAGNDVDPSLSADGRWLAFASDRAGGQGGYDVYLYDLVNSTLVPLPGLNTSGDERHPAITLSGNSIVFQVRPTPSDHWSLYVYTVSTQSLGQPTAFASTDVDRMQPYARAQ